MTNLSDLLPAGAASKQLSFTASGAISSGQTVGLKTDGTVEVIANTAEAVGTETEFTSVRSDYTEAVYDVNANRIVIFYNSNNSGPYGVVGTVSGSSISFGTPVATGQGQIYSTLGAVYDSTNNKVLFGYRTGTSSGLKVVVATVDPSDNSITFGTAAAVDDGNNENGGSMAYDANAQRLVVIFPDANNSQYGAASVGTVSGTSISFGTPVVYTSAALSSTGTSTVYDPVSQKVLVGYRPSSGSGVGYGIVGTVSGTSISFGTPAIFSGSLEIDGVKLAYSSSASKILIVYEDINAHDGHAVTATISGTSASYGTDLTWVSDGLLTNALSKMALNEDTNANLMVLGFNNKNYQGQVVNFTISGDTVTASSITTWDSGTQNFNIGGAYHTVEKKTVFSWAQAYSTGEAITYSPAFNNASSFLGIADAAISNAASGKITMKGGVATNSNLIESNVTVGSESVFDTESAAFIQVAYDSGNNKIVIAYADGGNSNYGTAIVGTVSGSSVTFGSAVVFNSAAVGANSIVYDVNAGKVVISYQDGGASNRGRSVVGTVSGTSISFGSEAQFSGSSSVSTALSSSYDANAQKVVIVYQDGGNSDYGTAVVGTISGTDITFGSSAVYLTAGPALMDIAYDTGAQKHLIVFQDGGNSNYTTGIVGTVSGTSISFGSKVAINNYNGTDISIAYDSTAAKTVVAYRSIESSPYQPEAVVATISGTSVSFGTKTKDTNFASGVGGLSIAYNPTIDKTLLIVRDEATGTKLGYVLATVSGTGISFGTSAFANADSTSVAGPRNIAYDSSGQKLIACVTNNTDTAGDSYVFSSVTGLTPNSTYYVQNDGTLSTTSSSVTAGKAMSTTSINLDYST